MDWQRHPLFRLSLAFIAGMIIADATIAVLIRHTMVLFISLCLCAILLTIQNGRKSRGSHFTWFGATSMTFVAILGATLYTLSYKGVQDSCANNDRQGVVVKEPLRKAHSWAVIMENGNGGKFIAYIDDASDSTVMSNIQTGDTIYFTAQHFSPTCPLELNDVDSAFAPYRQHLFFSGIGATCYIHHDRWTLKPTNRNASILEQWRDAMSDAYSDAGLTDEEGALVEALTTGNKSLLPKDLKEHYSRSGISHLLALSGFHLAVIFAMLNILLAGIVLPYGWQWTKSIVIVGCLWTFTLLADAPPSLVRATVMCSIMSIGGCIGRPVLSINSLALAAVVMLCANPMMINDVGFQLSYVSVLAICIIAVPCYRKFEERLYGNTYPESALTRIGKRTLSYFAGVAIISFACSVTTAPLVAYHFHSVAMLSVLTNLIVSVLAAVLLYASALWWMLFWWDGARLLLTTVLEHSARLINSVAEWISSFSWAVVAWSPTTIQLLLCYILITSAIAFFYRHTATSLKLTLIFLVALLATFL